MKVECVEASDVTLTICTTTQKLWLSDGSRSKEYSVSTSRFGEGVEEGSNRTPLGSFQVCEKFGETEAINTIYRGRKPIATYLQQYYAPDQGDYILTRILRLSGLDKGNDNTYSRYIYLHGTNHETLIGTPASIGCIRMFNKDIVDLYRNCPLGSKVIIK